MSMILLIVLVAVGGWLVTGMARGARASRARDATGDFSRALAAMRPRPSRVSPPSSRRGSPRQPRGRGAATPRRRAGR